MMEKSWKMTETLAYGYSSESYLMNTNMTGLDGVQIYLRPCSFDGNILSIGSKGSVGLISLVFVIECERVNAWSLWPCLFTHWDFINDTHVPRSINSPPYFTLATAALSAPDHSWVSFRESKKILILFLVSDVCHKNCRILAGRGPCQILSKRRRICQRAKYCTLWYIYQKCQCAQFNWFPLIGWGWSTICKILIYMSRAPRWLSNTVGQSFAQKR